MNTTKAESPNISQPQSPTDDKLVDEVLATPNADLSRGVAATEGFDGARLEPVYSHRRMRCYSVTESELKQIGLANIGITTTASLGSGFLAFGLDVFKDTLLAERVPEAAQAVVSYVQPICLFVGVAFWVAALATMKWRSGLIDIIKDESNN